MFVDPLLLAAFSQAEEEKQGNETIILPMILNVSSQWVRKNIPDFTIMIHSGNIVGCWGSRATVDALKQDKDVWYIEYSRPVGTSE